MTDKWRVYEDGKPTDYTYLNMAKAHIRHAASQGNRTLVLARVREFLTSVSPEEVSDGSFDELFPDTAWPGEDNT